MTDTALPVAPSPVSTAPMIWGFVLLVLAIVGGLFGLLWIVTFYVSQGQLPIPALGSWNLMIGGFFFIAGIPMFVVGILLLVAAARRRGLRTTP